MGQTIKREDHVREIAASRNLTLVKSPERDPAAPDYDLYTLVEASSGDAVEGRGRLAGCRFCLTLDDVAALLDGGLTGRPLKAIGRTH